MRTEEAQPKFVQLPPTQWSLVLAARDPSSGKGAEALEELCQLYYYPLYAFVRRQGYVPEDAEDLIQGFFCRVVDKNYLGQAEATRGRFRTFLLVALRHFLANEWHRVHAVKRGGKAHILSLDNLECEARYAQEPVDSLSPDQLYDRAWAMTVLERVKIAMRQRFAVNGEAARFALLEDCLLGEHFPGGYHAIAERLGTTEMAIRAEVNRLRRRFRLLLREEIARTIAETAEVDEELRVMISALRGSAG